MSKLPQWEIERCGHTDQRRTDQLLRNGFEPFAVAGLEIWFKRLAPAWPSAKEFSSEATLILK